MLRSTMLAAAVFGLPVVLLAAQAAGGAAPVETSTPFFCNLKALTPSERSEHQALTVRLARSVAAPRELPDGYAFELTSTELSIRDLATWIDYERRCCPFFDFGLEWRRENGPITLRLTGRDGVKDFIRAEFRAIVR